MTYKKQTWRDLPDRTTPISAARLNHLETQYDQALQDIRAGGVGVYDVLSFGAKGDGLTDDSQAFNLAIGKIREMGGGVLLLPPGKTYWVKERIELTSNIVIYGYGATMTRRINAGEEGYAVFRTPYGAPPGWGGGGRNIIAKGIRFKGNLNPQTYIGGGCGFALNHADGVLIEDCVFEEFQAQGHAVADLIGCRNVVVRNIDIQGIYPGVSSGYRRVEAIQIGASTSGGASAPDPEESFDGLPCKNVLIENVTSRPFEGSYGVCPAPTPFGNHDQVLGNGRHENITVRGVKVFDPIVDTTTSTPGVMHFAGIDNLVIDGFSVTFSHPYSTPALLFVSYANLPLGDTVVSNVHIKGVLPDGPRHPIASSSKSSGPEPQATLTLRNVSIETSGDVPSGATMNAISLGAGSLRRAVVSNVRTVGGVRGLYASGLDSISISDFDTSESPTFSLYLLNVGDTSIRDSVVRSAPGGSCALFAQGSASLKLTGTTLLAPDATDATVRVNGCESFTFVGNIMSGSTSQPSVRVYGSGSPVGALVGNVTKVGSATLLNQIPQSTVVDTGNVVA